MFYIHKIKIIDLLIDSYVNCSLLVFFTAVYNSWTVLISSLILLTIGSMVMLHIQYGMLYDTISVFWYDQSMVNTSGVDFDQKFYQPEVSLCGFTYQSGYLPGFSVYIIYFRPIVFTISGSVSSINFHPFIALSLQWKCW